MDDPSYQWRGPFADAEVNALHAEGFGHPVLATGWREQVERHSLGWVCAHDADRLVGFVNVAWDGGVHAFVVDTVVAAGARHRGIGVGLLDVARREREPPAANGSTWTSRKNSAGSISVRVGSRPPQPASSHWRRAQLSWRTPLPPPAC